MAPRWSHQLTASSKRLTQRTPTKTAQHESSRLEVFRKKGVLRNFTKFTGKHLCQGLFFSCRDEAGSYRKPPVAASDSRKLVENM